jgi:hypothetical protein
LFQYLGAQFNEGVKKIVLHSVDGVLIYEQHKDLPVNILREDPDQKEVVCTYDLAKENAA